ncbi:thioesterase II family protein [Streptomyces sp. NPDC102451]|uniref:thioesterase II family protein n=1 Tax=Streptomyces sp. NPDC102451 TaxID=3366177 RepID=UPI00380BCC25
MTRTSPWLVVPQPRPEASHRLVCFPHAGGGPNFYRGWSRLLNPSVELQIVHYPGRENRLTEPLVSDPDVLVHDVATALAQTNCSSVSTVFFGHSMGALLAHEVSRALDTLGFPVINRLILSACTPPGPASHGASGTEPTPRSDAAILDAVRGRGGTPTAVLQDADLQAMLLPIFRNDYLLVDLCRRRPAEPVKAAITALGGDRDDAADPAGLSRWARYTAGDFDVRIFPGGHFYLASRQRELMELLYERTLR